MDSLDSFIKKKKEEIKEIKGNKRWFKQAELESKKKTEINKFYENEYKKKKTEEYERLKKLNDELDAKRRISNADVKHEETNTEITLTNRQIIILLRQLKEPIRLFGETDLERYNRLKELKINKNELKINVQNVFGDVLRGKLKENSLDLIEDNLEEDIDNANSKESAELNGTTAEKKSDEKGQGADKEKVILDWIKSTMKEWNEEIENSDDSKKKIKKATYLQTHKDLKPLEKKLKQKSVEGDVLDKIYNIVSRCQERNFKAAHDAGDNPAYMLLAIGNAAWPMGVTMVGIHERAGRSKIFASEVAHILNDETTRKYIQMIKRLLSFCQRKYCTNPSEAVNLSTIHI